MSNDFQIQCRKQFSGGSGCEILSHDCLVAQGHKLRDVPAFSEARQLQSQLESAPLPERLQLAIRAAMPHLMAPCLTAAAAAVAQAEVALPSDATNISASPIEVALPSGAIKLDTWLLPELYIVAAAAAGNAPSADAEIPAQPGPEKPIPKGGAAIGAVHWLVGAVKRRRVAVTYGFQDEDRAA